MKILKKEEMMMVTGGGFSVWGFFGLGTLITFIIGAVDGFARPFACHK